MASPGAERRERLQRETCGWPVRRPDGANSGWVCNAPFGHKHPHALILGGRARAWSAGFR